LQVLQQLAGRQGNPVVGEAVTLEAARGRVLLNPARPGSTAYLKPRLFGWPAKRSTTDLTTSVW
jgi:hypothetical protein